MNMSKDPDSLAKPHGLVGPGEDKQNPGALQQEKPPHSRFQHDAPALEQSLEALSNEGFPVMVVPTEKSRILYPPCKVCGNLDPANFQRKSESMHGRFHDIFWDEIEGKSSLEYSSCVLIRAIYQPYKENIRSCSLWYDPQGSNMPGLVLRIDCHDFSTLELEICAREGTPCPWSSISHRPLTWNATAASHRISQWLDECSSNHDCYDISLAPVLPTRLLKIEGPRKVRLHVSGADERASYACLSHCWGNVVPLQLSRVTLRSFQKGIPWDALPRTFQDAVEVVRGMGLGFIWIDSLCIIQDDTDDWRRESGLMVSVYSRAYVTLAASQAADSTQGLFLDPNLAKHTKIYIGRGNQGIQYQVFIRQSPRNYDSTDLPLIKRAWVFQENLLSPRTASFTESFLYLACYKGLTHADQNHVYPSCHNIPFLMKHGQSDKSQPVAWYLLMAEYSDLSLTYSNDVFPALQGIAKRIQTARGCAYFAGLWSDSALTDLLWYKCDEATDLNTPQYRAPTWSWASRPGRVFWDTDFCYAKNPGFRGKVHSNAICISISTTPAGVDPLGEIISGEIQLQGYCLPAVVLYFGHDFGLRRITLKDISIGEYLWWPDINPSQLPEENVTVIYMGMGRTYPAWLVLVPTGTGKEEYKRVGIIGAGTSSLDNKISDLRDVCIAKGERKTVTIV